MLTIDLKSLAKHFRPAVEYLSSKLDDTVNVKGSQVQLAVTKARTAKLLLHKFLRQQGLEEWRVHVVHPGRIEVLGPRHEKQHPLQKPINAFARNETIPYYQAAAEVGGVVPKPGRRKWRP